MPTLYEIVGNIEPIIDTFRASALRNTPGAVRTAYEPNAERYFASEAVRQVRDNLLKRLKQGERALGYLIGEYGYGKTAAAIYLWRECERNGIVAVPPFQFTSFDDLTEAVTGWLRQAIIDRRADLVPQVDALQERYHGRSVEQRATELARQHDLPVDKAREIVAKEIAPITSIGQAGHVSDFLEAATRLAQEAGYQGLIVFADEMQAFLEAGDIRKNIEALRQLVLALRLSKAVLGLMLVIHERSAMLVAENTGDAMQRLQDDGAALNLGQHLDVEFPRHLMEYLCQKAGVERDLVVDTATLEALGQITLRKDLSNGPRTVAAAVRCIVRHHNEQAKPYRIQDLARDYEERRIVFDGVERSLSGVMARLLADDVVRKDARYGDVVRFLCMFPEGAPEQFLRQYGLEIALVELAQREGLLGTMIYAPKAEHWALRALQLDAGAEDRLTEFVRQFRDRGWYHATPEERLQIARAAFAKLLLPEILPRRGPGEGKRKFWGHLNWDRESFRDPGEIILRGSFESTVTRFPERKVAILIGSREDRMRAYRPDEDTHLVFAFHLLPFGGAEKNRVETVCNSSRVDFFLNLDVSVTTLTPDHDFPPELQVLRDSIVPSQCTAAILLNLIFYIEDQLPRLVMPEADRQQIKQYLWRSALRNLEQLLFPADMEATGVSVQARGRQLLESIFTQKLEELYPHYRALHTGTEAQNDLKRYERLLKEGGFRLAVKRGQMPVRLSTTEFLQKAGGSTGSQFDAIVSRLKGLGLLETSKEETQLDDNGRRVRTLEFTLVEHPLEVHLRQQIERHGTEFTVRRGGRLHETRRLPREHLQRLAVRLGYLVEEFETILNLACWREWLDVEDTHVFLAVPDTDPDTLRREAQELRDQIEAFADVDIEEATALRDRLDMIARRIDAGDPEILSDTSVELRVLRERLAALVRSYARRQEEKRKELHGKVRVILRSVPELEEPIAIPGAIGGKLEEIRRRLQKNSVKLRTELQALQEMVWASIGDEDIESVHELIQQQQRDAEREQKAVQLNKQIRWLSQLREHLEHWKALAHSALQLEQEARENAPDIAERLTTWSDEVIMLFSSNDQLVEAIAKHTEFEPRLKALRAEQDGRAQQLRDAFTQYHARLCQLMRENRLPEPREHAFDPQNPDRSYEALAAEVARLLREALQTLLLPLEEIIARCTFLLEFRQRHEALAARMEAERMHSSISNAISEAHERMVLEFRQGNEKLIELCGAYAEALAKQGVLAQKVAALEQPDPPRPGVQEEVLLAIRRYERDNGGRTTPVTMAGLYQSLRKRQRLTANDLFSAVQQLYMQGNVEIILRERCE
ncbi:MAG: hypothetical protein NZ557_14315 [Chthonomonadaceae bacterium]|nr:hypothetical protein [Chthonomonadaceae bacterium]